MRRLLLILIAIALSGALGACGFKLRGAYVLPFDTLHIAFPEYTPLYAVLKRNIEASSQTRVVADKKDAQASFVVAADLPQKIVLSLNSSGGVLEYQLVRSFSFRVLGPDNQELVPLNTIKVRRDISFSDSQVLSKESEEALLWRDIETDLVQQILRRMAAAKPKPAEAD